ncbi:MAG: tetratricopeptide repeat protein [Deltaproteobacteria bacterium]|nr:tetratricopeptide repeat protein [Deltaproteobacteria bacterium]
MRRNGIKLKIIRGLIFLIFFFLPSVAVTETKVFIEEYTYQASEADSKLSSRVIALEQVKRLLLEKLGTYLESETEVKNFQLTKDQIITLTAGIVRTEIIDEKWDGKIYYLKARLAAEPEDLANSIENLRQDRQKTKELQEARKKTDEALREVERLRRELEIAKVGKADRDKYKIAVDRLSATDLVIKGLALGNAGKIQEAMEAFGEAIELDPKLALAYVTRGIGYGRIGNYQQAIRDFDRAIELEPKYADAYGGRGVTYGLLGDHRQAIRDFDRAIELEPKYPPAYTARGVIYAILGDHRQAIRDHDKAIELDTKYAYAYVTRGIAYGQLGNSRQAIMDLGRAIELEPKYADAYYYRGFYYGQLGNHQEEMRDYKTSARLGSKLAQNVLKSNEGWQMFSAGKLSNVVIEKRTHSEILISYSSGVMKGISTDGVMYNGEWHGKGKWGKWEIRFESYDEATGWSDNKGIGEKFPLKLRKKD